MNTIPIRGTADVLWLADQVADYLKPDELTTFIARMVRRARHSDDVSRRVRDLLEDLDRLKGESDVRPE